MISRGGLTEAIENSECYDTHIVINSQYTSKRSDSASQHRLTPSGTQHNPRSRTGSTGYTPAVSVDYAYPFWISWPSPVTDRRTMAEFTNPNKSNLKRLWPTTLSLTPDERIEPISRLVRRVGMRASAMQSCMLPLATCSTGQCHSSVIRTVSSTRSLFTASEGQPQIAWLWTVGGLRNHMV
jgi:hypothetical protein